jgi:hypothetical protein
MVRVASTRQVRVGWMVESTILGCAGPGLVLRETLSRLIFVERRLCIYRVVRDPQLGMNRFESPLLLGEEDSNHCATS